MQNVLFSRYVYVSVTRAVCVKCASLGSRNTARCSTISHNEFRNLFAFSIVPYGMTRYQAQNVSRQRQAVRVAHVYKNFAAAKGISHIGLGVAGNLTSKTLRSHGIDSEVWPCNTYEDIVQRLDGAQRQATARGQHPVSHVVISAPWVPTLKLQVLLCAYPDVQFAVVSHSNVGFLAADPNGIQLLREGIDLEAGYHNFALAGNCQKFCHAWHAMYGTKTTYLPNLYDVSSIRNVGLRNPWERGHVLRIGIFGATRPLKNMVSAAAAATQLGQTLRNDVQIHLSSGREEGGGSVRQAIKQITDRVPGVTVVEDGWRSWPAFRQVVGSMHLCLAPSYTESFNMCVADGIAEGVASVVSEAIDWVPRDWHVGVDDVNEMARAARRLLSDHHAVNEGQEALRTYVRHGTDAWMRYFEGQA